MNAALFDQLVDQTRTDVQTRRGLVGRNHPDGTPALIAPCLRPVVRMPHNYPAAGFNGDFRTFLHLSP
jgi:hypothetical protein